MKTKLAGLSLAAVAAFGAPALAGGDVIYTGVKDPYAAAVPVPAPAPIPIYEPEYYVRFDVGAAWLSSVGVFVVGCHDDGDRGSVLHRTVGAVRPGGDAFSLQCGAWVVAREDVGADGVEQCGLGE